jgi:hypothetical protein
MKGLPIYPLLHLVLETADRKPSVVYPESKNKLDYVDSFDNNIIRCNYLYCLNLALCSITC